MFSDYLQHIQHYIPCNIHKINFRSSIRLPLQEINPNGNSNFVVDKEEYSFEMLPYFQNIVDEIGSKGRFGGWLRVRVKMVEHPEKNLVQDDSIFK